MSDAVLHIFVVCATLLPTGLLSISLLTAGCKLVLSTVAVPHLLPALAAWVLASVPIGLLIGHSVLSEE